MARTRKSDQRHAELALRTRELELKYELKNRRCVERWQYARSLKLPLSIVALAAPVWMGAHAFGGKATSVNLQLSITIAVGITGAAAWLFERWRGRNDREELRRARERLARHDSAELQLPSVSSTFGNETAQPHELRPIPPIVQPEGGDL